MRSRSFGFRSSDSSVSWIRRTARRAARRGGRGRHGDAVAIGGRQGGESGAEFVGAVPAQLALVAFLELLAPVALLAVPGDLLVEGGDLAGRGAPSTVRRRRRSWRAVRRAVRTAMAPVPLSRCGASANAARRADELRVVGEHPGAVEVAARRGCCGRRRRRIDALGDEPFGDQVGVDRAEVDAHAARRRW